MHLMKNFVQKKIQVNFAVFGWNFSSSTNPQIRRSELQVHNIIECHLFISK